MSAGKGGQGDDKDLCPTSPNFAELCKSALNTPSPPELGSAFPKPTNTVPIPTNVMALRRQTLALFALAVLLLLAANVFFGDELGLLGARHEPRQELEGSAAAKAKGGVSKRVAEALERHGLPYDSRLVGFFPPETLLGDPKRISTVSNYSLSGIESYPMCRHPVWGKGCDLYRQNQHGGQREFRAKQQRARDAAPPHPMCPKSRDEPVVVQLSDFCYWRNWIHRAMDTTGCPVPCSVVDSDVAEPTSHVFLENCRSFRGRPKTQSVWGRITLEYFGDGGGTLSLQQMARYDIHAHWIRDVSDVYINYIFTWTIPCGHPKDWINSPCRKPGPSRAELKTKKFVAMFVSNCVSQRYEYIVELDKWIRELSGGTREITSYGKCLHNADAGGRQLGYADAEKRQIDKVVELQKFKFLLSFENSIRPDYFTEKQYQGILANVLPVTWAAPHAEDFVPGGAGSYLNALDFSTPKDLAIKMLELDGDDEAYLEYFAWRNRTELSPAFVAQDRYDATKSGADSFACRTCQHYLRRFCHREDV
ncbi:hypothetical protein BASA81_009802 [Batrachochytrium salamandrivorans]|nr:hypothetical protein BASA81_009802 [Batrachochytrium salamandrivorans]